MPPEGIVAVTFTNRAAREMRERLAQLLPDPLVREGVRVGTFHAFGLALLKAHAEPAGLSWPFTILNPEEREELLATLPACPRGKAAALAEAISLAKAGELRAREELPGQEELLKQYEATLALHNAVDLDDLLRLPVRLLEDRPEVLEKVRSGVSRLLIDEYQDVNAVQYRLVRLLMPAGDAPLFAIGDPDQAIYGFRGADSRYLRRFLEDYPGASVYGLKTSYRCSATILKASAEVLPPSGASRLQRRAAAGGAPAHQRARQRRERGGVRGANHRRPDGGHALLFPGQRGQRRGAGERHPQLRGHRRALPGGPADGAAGQGAARPRHPLPGGLRCPLAAEGAGPLDAARSCRPCGPRPTPWRASGCCGTGWPRRRTCSAGAWSSRRAATWQGCWRPWAAAFPEAADAKTPDWPAWPRRPAATSTRFLEAAVLGTEPDALARGAERVSLLTLHAAKGLEFPCVFITGCEDGLLPYTQPARRPADPEEERRLFYVGMTRAGTYLYLTHARRRLLFGRELRLPPSPYLAVLREELAERLQPDPQPAPDRDAGQLDLF